MLEKGWGGEGKCAHRIQLSLVSALNPALEIASQSISSKELRLLAEFANADKGCDEEEREEAISAALPILRDEKAAEEDEAALTSVLVRFASKLPPIPLPTPPLACLAAAAPARTSTVAGSCKNDLRSLGELRRRGEEGEAGVRMRPQSVSRA